MTILTQRSAAIVDHKKQKKDIVEWGKTAFIKNEPSSRDGSYVGKNEQLHQKSAKES